MCRLSDGCGGARNGVVYTSNSSIVRDKRLLSMRLRWLRRTASALRYGSLFKPSKMSSSAPLYTSSCCSSFFSRTAFVFVFSSFMTASCWKIDHMKISWWETVLKQKKCARTCCFFWLILLLRNMTSSFCFLAAAKAVAWSNRRRCSFSWSVVYCG